MKLSGLSFYLDPIFPFTAAHRCTKSLSCTTPIAVTAFYVSSGWEFIARVPDLGILKHITIGRIPLVLNAVDSGPRLQVSCELLVIVPHDIPLIKLGATVSIFPTVRTRLVAALFSLTWRMLFLAGVKVIAKLYIRKTAIWV
jgi:hypothetical protein